MEKIAHTVTDSTADLTTTMKEDFKAHIIPLKIYFEKKEYLDGELTSEEFYQKLEFASNFPVINHHRRFYCTI